MLERINYPFPFVSQEYPGGPARSPYVSTNRRIFNPAMNAPSLYNTSPSEQLGMTFSPQMQQGEGVINYGFYSETQETPVQPGTNVHYYPNIPTQTLHLPNTAIPRSQSDSMLSGYVGDHVSPNVTGRQLQHEVLQAPSWVNSLGSNEMNQDIPFHIPRANMASDQQSYSTTSEVTLDQNNPMIYK